jgi:hypothetical protein
MRYEHQEGRVVLDDEDYSFKIESDRELFAKKKADSKYRSLEFKAPRGLTRSQKETYLLNLRQQLKSRLSDEKPTNEGEE